jgi:hypothetical protein
MITMLHDEHIGAVSREQRKSGKQEKPEGESAYERGWLIEFLRNFGNRIAVFELEAAEHRGEI